MRTDRHLPRAVALAAALLLLAAGCAGGPGARSDVPQARATDAAPSPGARGDDCTLAADAAEQCRHPADVRAFLEDRAACDHFRSEPWPEGDAPADRARRRELVEKTASYCAGMDRRLAALRERYRGDAALTALLARFDTVIEP